MTLQETASGGIDVHDAAVELLRAAIAASGLSVRRFAREVLVRDPRTVWRWLAAETPIPRAVLDRITRLAAAADVSGSADHPDDTTG